MSEGKETTTAVGTVEEVLPNSLFRVRLSVPEEVSSESPEGEAAETSVKDTGEGELVLAYLAGKMRLHRIRVLVGDQVDMVLDPYGGRARIVRRLT
ncbi:MAG: translation initiation factor IF-1 [Candidatus Pacebacteria bacterium]|nr:translation initiation factor IF-1 [Candidatus Paceibacterota bacterium]